MTRLPIKEKVESKLNLKPFSDEKGEKVLNTALKLIDLRSLNRILEDLNQDERDELSDIINNEGKEEVLRFIKEKGFDFDTLIKEEIEKAEKKFEETIDDYEINS